MTYSQSNKSEWQTVEHVLSYLARADKLPNRTQAERVILDQVPQNAKRVLDLGTGDGRTLSLVRLISPQIEGVALDFSEHMLEKAREHFSNDPRIEVVKHDLSLPLPSFLGYFDVVVSSLAIHHLEDKRKKQLYGEIFDLLKSGGVFVNFDHVSSPTQALHIKALQKFGFTPETEDPSNKLTDVETQLKWLREIGFTDVDCFWKWLEVAVLAGTKK